MHTAQMISTHPDVKGAASKLLVKCIDECHACAQACQSCADACLGEEMVDKLRQCIRLNLDCADLCEVTGKIAGRRTGSNEEVLANVLQACADACAQCAEECGHHAKMEHCRICAEACRSCETACQEAMSEVSAGPRERTKH